MTEVVKKGDQVTINYVGKFEDGTVFDSTEQRDPFSFEAGGQQLISGMDNAVVGMAPGDKKTVNIKPEEAYGHRDDRLLIEVSKEQLPEGCKEGDVLEVEDDDPQKGSRWIVQQIAEDKALLDGNHPLAGRHLVFEIELVAIN